MQEEWQKPECSKIKLVKIACGNDDDQKPFVETQGLLQAYPKAVIAPTTVGTAAAQCAASKLAWPTREPRMRKSCDAAARRSGSISMNQRVKPEKARERLRVQLQSLTPRNGCA